MHPYSTDSKAVHLATLFVAVGAILSAWALGQVIQTLPGGAPWWLDTPAVLGFFGAYWSIYDRLAWRWRLFGLRLSATPDFNGNWAGTLHSSSSAAEVEATLLIRQTHS